MKKPIEEKLIKKFKAGDKIPLNGVFLYAKVVKEKYVESNWTWCGCPSQLNCTCATWDYVEYFYYEIEENN